MSLYAGLDMTKVMMGERAFQLSINLIAQRMDDNNVIGCFQTSQGLPLLHGSPRTHVLLLGDMIFRPRLVLASDEFRGSGFSHLATNGFAEQEKWLQGDTILAPFSGESAEEDLNQRQRGRR